MIAYLITNTANGKRYVGVTKRTIADRWHRHCLAAVRLPLPDYSLMRAIRKYGRDGFSIEEIACARSYKDLMEIEKILIAQENTLAPNGYNHTIGGGGVVGIPRDESYRQNIAASMKSVWAARNAETKLAINSKGLKNRNWVSTPEHGANLSRALTGKKKSDTHRAAISRARMGMQARLGQTNSPEHRAKISAARMGHEVSPETRAKIAASLRAWAVKQLEAKDERGEFAVPQMMEAAA